MASLLLVGLLAVVVPPGAGPAQAAGGFRQTKTVTREIMAEDGTVTVDERTVTVSADVTTDLRGRQVMTVRWSGAHPSGGIVGDIASTQAWERTEYPVVVLQCRGDDGSPDPAAHIRPETCWTTIASTERQWTSFGELYVHDNYSTEAERASSVPAGDDWEAVCNEGLPPGEGYLPGDESWPKRIIPFVAADGTKYWPCGGDGTAKMAPEMGRETALGWNERIAFTALDGSGVTTFEVRTAAENASLGCSAAVPCAVVVIPIMGISCDTPDLVCNREGLQPPGSTNNDMLEISRAVTGHYWASESNWRNRITIPVQIAPTDSICTDTERRITLQLYGSTLMYEAAEQWAPDYCTRPDRPVLRINGQLETRAFRSLQEGYGNGVLATYADPSPSVPLGYAPVGLTGFAVGFVIDIPGDGRQLEQLNLTPRLLAKLLTASYWGMNTTEAILAERPDLADNPRSLQLDPEFRALNPDLDVSVQSWNTGLMRFSSLGSLSVPSDLTMALTSYIAADPEAMAFIDGTPDPWGMRVNRAYEGISMPLDDWPLADDWVRPTADSDGCEGVFPVPWSSMVQAPVSDVHKLAELLLAGKSMALDVYGKDTNYNDIFICKTDRSTVGHGMRASLALVTLADAKRYALPTASLRTASGTYVAPTDTSIAAAAGLMTSAAPGEPFVPDTERLIASPTAYPGTMVVHAVLPLSGVERGQAAAAASFVRIATSEGQVRGTKSGQLADGYTPIASTGATAPLYAAAQAVADAVERQSGSVASTGVSPEAVVDTVLPVGLDALEQAFSALADILAAEPEAVDGLPAAEPAATTKPRRGITEAALFNFLRNAIPAGLALTTAAAVGVPVLRRFRVER